MKLRKSLFCLMIILTIMGMASQLQATSFATEVISAAQGTNPSSGYNDSSTVLGSPDSTMPWQYGGDITPFNAEWGTGRIFSIGAGGSLVVKFDHQVLYIYRYQL